MKRDLTILDAMQDQALFGPWFQGESWAAWKAFLAVLSGLPINKAALEIYRQHTHRTSAPELPAKSCVKVVASSADCVPATGRPERDSVP